jgi:hypothetical protein
MYWAECQCGGILWSVYGLWNAITTHTDDSDRARRSPDGVPYVRSAPSLGFSSSCGLRPRKVHSSLPRIFDDPFIFDTLYSLTFIVTLFIPEIAATS